MTKERSEVLLKDCWDLTPLYNSFENWEEEYKTLADEKNNPIKKLTSYRDRLADSPQICLECINLMTNLDRKISKLYTYAHLLHDQDMADDKHKKAFGLIRNVCFELQEALSWFEPEILQMSNEKLNALVNHPSLSDYKIYLEKIIRLKPHTLSAEQEEILSFASKALHSPQQIFSAYNNADIVFEKIQDSKGKVYELSHGSYHLYMESQDRELRRQAFESIHKGYKKFEHTVSEMLQAQVQSHLFYAKARHYTTCLEAALFPQQIDKKVYQSLIDNVKSRISVMHRYVSYRKEHFNLKKVHAYDMYVSCAKDVELQFSFNEAVDLIIEAVAVLGKDYQNTLKKGLLEERWVDRYENIRKRSGAYSSGCYDSFPYILMNYHGTLSDVLTLAHEAGHSMHSWFSHKHQPYQYSSYTIFVAEVASTFNEELVFRSLLGKAKTKEEKLFLVNKRIDGIRGTLFRQTLFAEFELKIHTLAEQGVPLTPKLLRELYQQLNQDYYGPDFCHDDLIEYEFLRIPHFYNNFYVYQYATGISAALALVEKVTKEKNPDSYLEFLSSGSKDYSLNLLKKAGVDMHSSEPVNILINQFDHLLNELKK